MYFQPKVLDEFLLVVLQYEHLKNGKDPRQAHKNISELLILDNIRRDMIGVHPPDTPTPPPSSSTTSSSSSVFSIESMSDDVFQSESAGTTPSEDGQVTSFDSTYGNPLNSPGPTLVVPWTWVPVNAVFNRDILLKEDEDDDMVQNIEFEEVERVFRDLEHGFEPEPKLTIKTQRLSELRDTAFTIISLHLSEYKKIIKDPKDETGTKTITVKRYKHPFDRLKTVTDHTELRIQLSDSRKKAKNLNIVYWKVLHEGSTTGCMLWQNDAVRFVEELDFENLAASEFIHILDYSTEIQRDADSVPPAVKLDNLEMLIAKKKKWSPRWRYQRHHSGDFFRPIKKWMKKDGKWPIHTKKYFMTFYLRKQEYLSFPLRHIRADFLNAITIRVWDDSQIMPVGGRALQYNLNPLDSTEPWGNARFLDIEDPNLVGWIPKIKLFHTVHMWEVIPEGLETLRGIHEFLPALFSITVKTGYSEDQRDFGIVRRP